jgi:hypothetical protein
MDPDYLSLSDAFGETHRVIEERIPSFAECLKDKFWSEKYECWDVTGRDLAEIQAIEFHTRPRRKKSALESILQQQVSVHTILLFTFMAGVLAFVIKIRFFSS